MPDYASRFPNLTSNYLEPAAKMQELAQNQGIEITYYPSGPLLEYNPAKVTDPPTSTDELLAWAKAHPGRFMYARPANSGPGRTLLMGLPYILGDSDPKDPANGWTKTWAYLKELGRYVPTYQLIAANPKESSLPAAQQVAAFDMWDRGVGSPGAWLVWGVVAFFFLNLAAVVGVAVLLGTPAAYALARRDFPGKRLVTVLFLLPILLPPIAYGIPLATVLYKYHLAGTLAGVVLANLVPSVPFVILVMTPFIEQIDPRIESAARMSGAATHSVFLRVLGPLLVPGVLAAAILVLVRTVGMFELTFLTAGSDSQTLIVALFYSVNAAGIRAQQSTDVMAVVYTLTMLVLLVIALRFVNPTQLVSQIKEETTG